MKYLVLFLAVFRVMAGPGDVPDVPEEFGGYRFAPKEELRELEKDGVKPILGPVPEGFYFRHGNNFKKFAEEEGGGVLPLEEGDKDFISGLLANPLFETYRAQWASIYDKCKAFHERRSELPNHVLKLNFQRSFYKTNVFDLRKSEHPALVVRSVRSPDEFWSAKSGVPAYSASLLTVKNGYYSPSGPPNRFVTGMLVNPDEILMSFNFDARTIAPYDTGFRSALNSINGFYKRLAEVMKDHKPETLVALNEKFKSKNEEVYLYPIHGERGVLPELTEPDELIEKSHLYTYNELLVLSSPLVAYSSKYTMPTKQVCWVMNERDYYDFILFVETGKFFFLGDLERCKPIAHDKTVKDFLVVLGSGLPIYITGTMKNSPADPTHVRDFMKTYQDGKYLLESV